MRAQGAVRAVARSLIRRALRAFGYDLVPVQAALPREVRADYEAILDAIGRYSFKFLDARTFVPETINRACALDLNRSRPLDVLDIGTGVGYFPVVCKHYGHRAIAIDRDGNSVFEDATRWLGVDRRSWTIQKFTSLPDLGRRFDLVTSFMINFDRAGDTHWGVDEWSYFLGDLFSNQLKPGGRVAFLLNEHTLRHRQVRELFAKHGRRVSGIWVFEHAPDPAPGSAVAQAPPSPPLRPSSGT